MNDSRALFEQLMGVGDIGQHKVITHYQAQGYTLLGLNHDYRYDLRLRAPDGSELLIEVKTDTTLSPNLAVETWSRHKPSGICATHAHRYCIYFTQSGELWDFCAATLKAELDDLATLKLVQVRAVQNNTWVRLLPKSLARSLFGPPHTLTSAPAVTGISVLNTAPPGSRAHGFFG